MNKKFSKKIKKINNKKFAISMLEELQKIFDIGLPIIYDDSLIYISGTCGWEAAFYLTCKKLSILDVYEFYCSLDWIESENFDEEIENILINHKLVYYGDIGKFLEKKYNLPNLTIWRCDACGKYIDKKEGKIEEELYFSCKDCDSSTGYTFTIEDLNLDINPSDYFICNKCKNIYLNAVKGKEHCIHCEQGKNKYYRDIIGEINEKRGIK